MEFRSRCLIRLIEQFWPASFQDLELDQALFRLQRSCWDALPTRLAFHLWHPALPPPSPRLIERLHFRCFAHHEIVSQLPRQAVAITLLLPIHSDYLPSCWFSVDGVKGVNIFRHIFDLLLPRSSIRRFSLVDSNNRSWQKLRNWFFPRPSEPEPCPEALKDVEHLSVPWGW